MPASNPNWDVIEQESGRRTMEVVRQLWLRASRLQTLLELFTGPKEVNFGDSGAAQVINWRKARQWCGTLTDDCTFTLVGGQVGEAYRLVLHTGAGGFIPSFPNVYFEEGTPPAWVTDANNLIFLSFDYTGVLPAGKPFSFVTEKTIPL